MSFLTVFKSFQDDGSMMMALCHGPLFMVEKILGPLDQQASP